CPGLHPVEQRRTGQRAGCAECHTTLDQGAAGKMLHCRSSVGSCLSVKSLARLLVEQMNVRRIWFEPDLFARLKLVPFTEHCDDFLATELGDHLRLRARRL